MKSPLTKLELLVDEVTGLVREERERRNQPPRMPWLLRWGGNGTLDTPEIR